MRRAAFVVVLLFTISGFSGLIYELVWVRLFSHLLGGTSLAISVVLASFMGGLALGSWWFGDRVDRSGDPLRLYARLELGVAVSAAAVPLWIAIAKPLYVGLAHLLPPGAMTPVRILLAFVLLLPPTFCMGGTLPVLGRFLVQRQDRLGRGLGLLYAANTLGAVAGAFLGGFVLIPALGLLACVAVGVGGNVLASGTAAWMTRWPKAAPPAAAKVGPRAKPGPPAPELGARVLAGAFALSGFAALGFELYWTRALHHFLGNSTYAFSAMLTTFLFGLAAGAWVGGRVADRVVSPARLLGWIQIGIALSATATVPLLWNGFARLDRAQFFSAPALPWTSYLLRRFLAAFAVMAVPTFLSGMAFPLVNRIGIDGLAHLGKGVGRLYSANTLGSIAGSLAAGFVGLPLLGARAGLLGTALLSGAVGVGVHIYRARRRRAEVLVAVAVVVALALLAPGVRRLAGALLSDTQEARDTVLFDREDATAETRVYQKANGERHVSVDGRHIGGTEAGIMRKEKALAHLPLALAPRAEKVLAVGLGSGITLGTLALYDEVHELTCVEIVPGVIAAAAQFRQENHDVLSDPRVRIVPGDGVQYLLTTRDRFDLISSDSKLNPEYSGNASMLSREYYELCRDRLTEHGVMVQWTGVHVPNAETRLVTRTFIEAFPYVELFWIDTADIVMAGSRSPLEFDFDRWRTRIRSAAVLADLRSQGWDDPDILATCRVAGRSQLAAELGARPLNTWLRPTFEFQVVHDFRLKGAGYHENDNLRWLAALWSPEGFRIAGSMDRDRLARFRDSTHQYLLGCTTGGGVSRLAGGRAMFEAGLARNPEDFRLAKVLQQLAGGEPGRTAAPPTDAASWVALGLHQMDAGHAKEALESFEHATALDLGSAEARYDRLVALRHLAPDDRVRPEIEKFTRDFPRDARGWSLLGQALAQAGDLEASLAALRRATDLDPSTASFRNNLAVTLVRLARFEEAAKTFAQVYALDPLFPDAAFFTAISYSRAGKLPEAAQWVDLCLDKKLGDPSRFLTDENLTALRASPQWQQARVLRAVAAWRASGAGLPPSPGTNR
jgi:spermidine synthase